MAEQDSGRPPPEAFHTVSEPEQARLLSDPQSFRFFEPFIARERSVKVAAEEVGCTLDVMLYRVKTLLAAGLLRVARLEKRAGRPIKHYRSVHDAYFIPFEVTPYAGLEERLAAHYRKRQALAVPVLAKALLERGNEGRRIFRRLDNGDVWQESAADIQTFTNVYDVQSYQDHLARDRGRAADMLDDTLVLTDEEARMLLAEMYGVWRRFQGKRQKDTQSRQAYFFSFALLRLGA